MIESQIREIVEKFCSAHSPDDREALIRELVAAAKMHGDERYEHGCDTRPYE